MTINIGDLVGLRVSNSDGYRSVWFRVEEIDAEKTKFIGKLERFEWDFTRFIKEQRVQIPIKKIKTIFDEKDGLDWCYSDTVTRCDCKGLCRNN
jgi:hypothetical protein